MTSSVVVSSKAARCRTGQTLVPQCLVPQLWSESNVTDVALREWFARCGSILARFDISLSSVVVPRGALQNQVLSSVVRD